MRTLKYIYLVAAFILIFILYGLYSTAKALIKTTIKLAPTLLLLYAIFKLYNFIIDLRETYKNKADKTTEEKTIVPKTNIGKKGNKGLRVVSKLKKRKLR
tara:strand:- start:33 stop:332 length:300 start_codon:yes stop_codon:yes gene_type:complete